MARNKEGNKPNHKYRILVSTLSDTQCSYSDVGSKSNRQFNGTRQVGQESAVRGRCIGAPMQPWSARAPQVSAAPIHSRCSISPFQRILPNPKNTLLFLLEGKERL